MPQHTRITITENEYADISITVDGQSLRILSLDQTCRLRDLLVQYLPRYPRARTTAIRAIWRRVKASKYALRLKLTGGIDAQVYGVVIGIPGGDYPTIEEFISHLLPQDRARAIEYFDDLTQA